jgi:hypothetical protein
MKLEGEGPQSPNDAPDSAAQAEALFDGGEAVSEGAADAALSSLFDGPQHEARYRQDEAWTDHLDQARKDLTKIVTDFGVGQADMNILASVGAEYGAPLGEEGHARLEEQATEALQTKYGDRANDVLAAAQRVAHEAMQRRPELKEWFDNGAGSDPRVIDAAIRIARRKGYLK